MTPLLFLIALIAELFLVAGQLLMKRAMLLTNQTPTPKSRFAAVMAVTIFLMTIYFFLWLGLMRQKQLPLSQLYSIDAIAPVLLVLGATVFLKEHLSIRSWLGILLISTGIAVISLS